MVAPVPVSAVTGRPLAAGGGEVAEPPVVAPAPVPVVPPELSLLPPAVSAGGVSQLLVSG